MQNQTKNLNKDSDSKKAARKIIFSKINITLFVFIVLNIILMALFYFGLKSKIQDKKILGNGKVWNITKKCSSKHPEFCDKSCAIDSDCYPSCTHNCGCLKSGEKCQDGADDIMCEVAPFSCKCVNNSCEIVEYQKEETKTPDKKINIIGNYINGITSMCSQNCNRYYIGAYELADELQDVDGNDREEIIFASGKMEKIIEPPTIAGPDSNKQDYDKEIESVKLKINNYKKINFPKISISENELANYLNNKDSKFVLEFENPLDEELKFKVRMNDNHDFQHFVLAPKEVKSFEYIYSKDDVSADGVVLENARSKDDGFNLVIVNDFVDDINFKEYYWDEAENINSAGTMVYIEKYVRLEDCKTEINTSDWQTYINNEEQDRFIVSPIGGTIESEKTNCEDEIDTDCWMTYLDKEYGYELKYPQKWKIKPQNIEDKLLRSSGKVYISLGFRSEIQKYHSFNIEVIENHKNLSLEKWLDETTNEDWRARWNEEYIKKITIGGINGLRIGLTNGAYVDAVVIKKDNKIYWFSQASGHGVDNPVETFNTMLSTFKFTDEK